MTFLPTILIGSSVGVVLAFLYQKKKKIENQPITYQQFIQQLSNQIDNYMISEEKKTGLIMYGGECEVFRPKDDIDSITMKIVLFGKKKKSDKWSKSEIIQKLHISDFTDDSETQSKLENLKSQSEKFKVNRPGKE